MTPTRRDFLIGAAAVGNGTALERRVATLLTTRPMVAGISSEGSGPAQLAIANGPFVGHLTASSVTVWANCPAPGVYHFTAHEIGQRRRLIAAAEATPENDMCVVWRLAGLQAETTYGYQATYGDQPIFGDDDTYFTTPAAEGTPTLTRLAFGSCAYEDSGSSAVWRRMASVDPHAVVLLGDTPYIDTTALDVQRTRYSEFAAVADFADLLRNRPLYATWDDHDFGANDTDGQLAGKANARQAFVEYHANPSYGDGTEGIYTKFLRGGVEVFLLDTRYFAGTEPSSGTAAQPTLLGRQQWEWLRQELRASTAPFKLLASGMIWNGAVRPGKPDHWGSYPHEREALFRFIGEEGISGVVLVGGDIHRTRVLRHQSTELTGYPLVELITSPIHASIIDAANAPHPDLVHDSGEPHSFLLITVDTTVTPPTLVAQFQNAAGRELYSLTLSTAMLSAAPAGSIPVLG